MELRLSKEQKAERERDKETLRGINRANAAIRRVLGHPSVQLAVLSALVVAGTAPKRWHPLP